MAMATEEEIDAAIEDTESLLASLGLDQDDGDSLSEGEVDAYLFGNDEEGEDDDDGVGHVEMGQLNRSSGAAFLQAIRGGQAHRILWSEFSLLLIFFGLCTVLVLVSIFVTNEEEHLHDANNSNARDRVMDPTNNAQKTYLQQLNQTLARQNGDKQHRKNAFQLCFDTDDDAAFFKTLHCECTSPWQARPRPDAKWQSFHEHLVREARRVPSSPTLDVLMLGDALVERRMGTKNLAKAAVPEFKEVHDKYFDKLAGAPLHGIPLGAGGDTSYELLWQVQHGVLSGNLQPRAILLLIGTNDAGRVGCSKRNSLAGILHVANYLHARRPDAAFILHAITPCADTYRDGNYTLGYKYDKIKWINAELKKYVELNSGNENTRVDDGTDDNRWYFVDNNDIFLARPDRNKKHKHGGGAAKEINSTVMWDGLHPTPLGYELWNERLSAQITKILAQHDKNGGHGEMPNNGP